MKRLILSILAFLLLAAPALAFDGACQDGEPWQLARMNPAVLGASSGAADCTETDSYTTRTYGILLGYDSSPDRWCGRTAFTASGTGTYTVKNIQLQIKKVNSGAQTLTVSMCDSDGKSNCVVWDDTISVASQGTGNDNWASVNDSSGKSLSNGTVYTIIVSSDAIDATNYFSLGYQGSTGSVDIVSNDKSGCSGGWATQQTAAVFNLKLNTCAQ